jgi:hypothetical protein
MMAAAVFTLDVGDRPVLAFEAKNLRESWEICHEQWLKEDLVRLQSNAVSLWDGKARLRSRYASETETELYRQAAQVQDGEAADDLLLVYLVELDVDSAVDVTVA